MDHSFLPSSSSSSPPPLSSPLSTSSTQPPHSSAMRWREWDAVVREGPWPTAEVQMHPGIIALLSPEDARWMAHFEAEVWEYMNVITMTEHLMGYRNAREKRLQLQHAQEYATAMKKKEEEEAATKWQQTENMLIDDIDIDDVMKDMGPQITSFLEMAPPPPPPLSPTTATMTTMSNTTVPPAMPMTSSPPPPPPPPPASAKTKKKPEKTIASHLFQVCNSEDMQQLQRAVDCVFDALKRRRNAAAALPPPQPQSQCRLLLPIFQSCVTGATEALRLCESDCNKVLQTLRAQHGILERVRPIVVWQFLVRLLNCAVTSVFSPLPPPSPPPPPPQRRQRVPQGSMEEQGMVTTQLANIVQKLHAVCAGQCIFQCFQEEEEEDDDDEEWEEEEDDDDDDDERRATRTVPCNVCQKVQCMMAIVSSTKKTDFCVATAAAAAALHPYAKSLLQLCQSHSRTGGGLCVRIEQLVMVLEKQTRRRTRPPSPSLMPPPPPPSPLQQSRAPPRKQQHLAAYHLRPPPPPPPPPPADKGKRKGGGGGGGGGDIDVVTTPTQPLPTPSSSMLSKRMHILHQVDVYCNIVENMSPVIHVQKDLYQTWNNIGKTLRYLRPGGFPRNVSPEFGSLVRKEYNRRKRRKYRRSGIYQETEIRKRREKTITFRNGARVGA